MLVDQKWSINDFLVRGEFCPLSNLKLQLDGVARASDAACVVLLVACEERFFGSLLICGGPHTRLVDSLQAHLKRHQRRAVRSAKHKNHVPELFELLDGLTSLGELCGALSIPQFPRGRDMIGVGIARLSQLLRTGMFLINSNDHRAEPMQALAEWDSLESHACCTVQYVMRDRFSVERSCDETARLVESSIDFPISRPRTHPKPQPSNTWALTPDRNLCNAFLKLIASHTRSERAALFGLLRNTQGLDLTPIATIGPALNKYDAELVQNVVQEAYHSKQPFVNAANNRGVRFMQLGFPIAYRRFETRSADSIAVIFLQTSSSAKRFFYNAGEIEMLRTVAMHFRRHHDWLLLRESTALLAQITGSTDHDPNVEDQKWKPFVSFDARQPIDKSDLGSSILPIEVEECRAPIISAMSGLYELTRARSVALRVLTTDSKYLLRCINLYGSVASGTGRILDVRREWQESANAWCAMNGLPCDIPNVTDRRYKKRHFGLRHVILARERDQLASLYCTPVWCQQRVIGTLNVESVYPHAFTVSKDLVNAIASQIGSLVGQARFSNERLLHVASPMGDAVHAASKLHTEIRAIEKHGTAPNDLLLKLSAIEKHANTIAFELRGDDFAIARKREPRDCTLRNILEEYIESRELIHGRLLDSPSMNRRPAMGEHGSRALRQCLHEILQNAREHCDHNSPVITIQASEMNQGGSRWLLVNVKNRLSEIASNAVSIETITCFGRKPLEKSGSLHWGALLAGATVRSRLGGELYIRDAEDGFFSVTLQIPLEDY